MIQKCDSCGGDFLTEADMFVVDPTPQGVKFYCHLHIKKTLDEVKRLKHEIEVLRLYGNKDCTAMADEALGR